MSLARKLNLALALARTERPICRWLKLHPLVVARTLSNFQSYAISEFPFGSDFRADFVVLAPFSGGWDVDFVELEPPTAPLFTRAGKPARHLVDSMDQIDRWRTFIEKNRPCVLRELSKFATRRDLLSPDREDEPIDNCGWPLYHPNSGINWQFSVIIGRRKNLIEEEIGKKTGFFGHHRIEVMTYDRLVDTAQMLDRHPEG